MSMWARRLSVRVVAAVTLASGLAACSWPGGFRPEAPLVVSLPIALAGVSDRRAVFAGLMERELRREATSAPGSSVDEYLQVPAGAQVDDQLVASIMQKAASKRPGTSVMVISGIFGDCVDEQSLPFGDGKLRTPAALNYEAAYAQYADVTSGFSVKAVQIPGRASSEANGRVIAQAIASEAARPGVQRIVVIAYSKGLPDTLQALASLEAKNEIPPQLKAVVSVAGVVMGTPLADRFASFYDSLGASLSPLGCSASQGGEMQSLTRKERREWLAAHALPETLHYYSIVAHASPDHVAPGLRPFYRMLAEFDDRNDGQMIASDAILPSSDVLAVVNSDHWTFVLPLSQHPSVWVRSLASGEKFPREALFRSTLDYVLGTLR
jgi:hypothetical protein